MPQDSIWKENDKPLTRRQQRELESKTSVDRPRECKHFDSGRCYAPFAESRAQRCRGSIGCVNFEIIWKMPRR